jgi:hypothetical protein
LPDIPIRQSRWKARGMGTQKDYLGMSVSVTVHKVGEIADPSEG